MEDKKTSIGFFKKVWYSITKFEKYPEMAAEGVGKAIKYLVIFAVIITIFTAIGSVKEMHKMVQNLASYIEREIPEFTYEDKKVSMEIEEPIVISEVDYSTIDRIVIDANSESDEQKNATKQNNDIVGTTIFFYKNQIILRAKTESGEEAQQEYTYDDFIKSYTGTDIKTFDKAQLVEYMRSDNMSSFYYRYTGSVISSVLIVNIFVALIYSLELALLGWITTVIARIKIRFVALYNMSAYALTLPMILNILYIIVNYFTKFTITYFEVAYMALAYVYLVAAIFLLKDDFIKQQQEVSKIKQEQEKVREEIKEEPKEEEPEEKDKEEDNDEENNNQEPDGSQA